MKATAIKAILLAASLSVVPTSGAAQPTAVDYQNRGNAEQAKGDLDGAIADYNRAIELDPKNADTYNNRAAAKRAKGDLDGTIADYNRAIELDPKDAKAYIFRGLAKQAKGDRDGGTADLKRAIELKRAQPNR